MTILKNRKGSGYFTPCVITLVIVMILSVVIFYANTMTIIETTRENTEMVLDSFVMKNSIEIYNSIKQGHDFTEKFTESFYFSEMSRRFSLDYRDNCLYNIGEDGETVYYLTNPNVSYKVDKTLKLKADYTLYVPVRFAGEIVYWTQIPLTVTSELTLKD